MKARIQSVRETALLYRLGTDDEKGRAARDVLAQMGIETRGVTPAMLNQTLGSCAGLVGFPPPDPDAVPPETLPPHEALIMAGLGDKRMQELLDRLRDRGVAIRLKAVLTPTNRRWTLLRLLGELSREEELMAVFAPLQSRLREALAIDPDSLAEEARSALGAAIARAAAVVAGRAPQTPQTVREADGALCAALEALRGAPADTD